MEASTTLTPTTIESLTYTYDKGGNRIAQLRQNAAASNLPTAVAATNIAYDAANELTRWNSATTNLTYDNNGNLSTETQGGVTTTYTWDSRNRLAGIGRTGLTASFVYDGLGRRKSKTINGTTTGFWFDGNDVYAELAGVTPSATYIRGLNIDEPYIRKGASDEFYETDALGSSLVLTDPAGASQTTYTYEPFGNTTQTGSASTNTFQYTGRENDGTGLYYFRARYYAPRLQRFAAEDPIGLAGGDVNQYAFVRNSPCNYIDPLGLERGVTACFSKNRFANLFEGSGYEDVVTGFEMVSLVSVAGDLVAVGAKSMRAGIGGSQQRYASGLNYVFRKVGRAVGSTALTGSLVAIGSALTPTLALSGAFMGAYDATIFTQCLLGVLD